MYNELYKNIYNEDQYHETYPTAIVHFQMRNRVQSQDSADFFPIKTGVLLNDQPRSRDLRPFFVCSTRIKRVFAEHKKFFAL